MANKKKRLTRTDKMIIYAKCHKGPHFFIKLFLSLPFLKKNICERLNDKKKRQNAVLAFCILLLLTISIVSVLISTNEDSITYEMVFAAETGMFEPGYVHTPYAQVLEEKRARLAAEEEARLAAEKALLEAASKPTSDDAPLPDYESRYYGIISEGSVFEIRTYDDLCLFRDFVNDYHTKAHAVLVSDIETDPSAGYFTPIANSGNNTGLTFNGSFDGNGFSIMGLRTDPAARFCGLFGTIGEAGVVRSLTLTDCELFGTEYIGAVAAENKGTITECETFGSITTDKEGILLGGIAGTNGGTINECRSSCKLSGGGYIGGIAGENYGTVTACTYSGTAECEISLGGIVGQNEAGIVDSCTCNSYALIHGDTGVGGIVGTNSDESSVTNCGSWVSPAGLAGFGDIIGINYGSTHGCYLILSANNFDYDAPSLIGLNYGTAE